MLMSATGVALFLVFPLCDATSFPQIASAISKSRALTSKLLPLLTVRMACCTEGKPIHQKLPRFTRLLDFPLGKTAQVLLHSRYINAFSALYHSPRIAHIKPSFAPSDVLPSKIVGVPVSSRIGRWLCRTRCLLRRRSVRQKRECWQMPNRCNIRFRHLGRSPPQ